MSDYGDDDLDWGDPDLLAELDSLESNAIQSNQSKQLQTATKPQPRQPVQAQQQQQQQVAPRASQIPPKAIQPAAQQAVATKWTSRQQNGGSSVNAAASALPTASPYGNARPGKILRPPKPPARASTAARPTPAAAALNQDLAHSNGNATNVKRDPEDDEENLPAITVNENGYQAAAATITTATTNGTTAPVYRAEPQRGTTISRPAAAVAAVAPTIATSIRRESPAPVQQRPAPVIRQPSDGVPPVPRSLPAAATSAAAPHAAHQTSLSAAGPATSAAGGSGISASEREELERLRREKAEVERKLAAAGEKTKELQSEVLRRTGEVTVIRNRLTKAENAYQQRLNNEMRDKARIQKELEDKQRDLARAIDTIKYDGAFRKVETESSGGRSLASASAKRTYRAHASQRQSSQQPRGPSVAPESPTANRRGPPVPHRTARAATEQPVANSRPPPPAGPVFANFQNSFAAPSAAAAPSRRAESVLPEREGPMGPPAIVKDKGAGGAVAAKRQAPATPPAPASKRRKDVDGTPVVVRESPRRAPDMGQVEQTATDDAADAGYEEEPPAEPWIWIRPDKDARGDLLAAVFAHVTFGPLDMEPVVVSGPAGAHHMRATATARAGTARSTLAAGTASRQGSRQKAATPTQATTVTGSQPTIHALTNLRFPPSTALTIVEQYEALTRELFATLGHSHDARMSFSQIYGSGATAGSEAAQRANEILFFRHPDVGPLAIALANLFTSMLRVLNTATLTGPLTALLKLVSHLAFLSPAFALACCGAEANVAPSNTASSTQRKAAPAPAPTALISLVAHVIARYGRPSQADREKQSRTAMASAASNASTANRPRRAKVTRSSAGRRNSSMTGALGGKKGNLDAADLVENFDPEKRAKLLDAALSLLESVAWKCLVTQEPDDDGGAAFGMAEDAFFAMLAVPNAIATLLDPAHPPDLLLLSSRFLCMLAGDPGLFRKLVGVKFYELVDVRTSQLPLIDRIATLLSAPRSDSPVVYNLDLSLVSLATVFVGSHDDAIRFVAHSNSFVSELLSKTWRDVRFLCDWDGRVVPANGPERDLLNRTTHRLSRLVRLFYYLALAPHAPYRVHDLVTGPPDPPPELALAVGDALGTADGAARAAILPQRRSAHARQAAHDLFMSAFGMLAFATMGASEGITKTLPNGRTKIVADPSDESSMPSWAEPGSHERRTLIELGFLAQEILEDVSPDELDEIEACFGPVDEGADDDDEQEISVDDDELEITEAGVDAMQVDPARP